MDPLVLLPANKRTFLLNKAKVDIRIRPWCRQLANSTKHNVVFDFAPLSPLCENMMSSTKPEVHNITYCATVRGGPSHGHR